MLDCDLYLYLQIFKGRFYLVRTVINGRLRNHQQVQADTETFPSRTASSFEFPSVEFVTFFTGLSKK